MLSFYALNRRNYKDIKKRPRLQTEDLFRASQSRTAP
jgi:hypothetical protein